MVKRLVKTPYAGERASIIHWAKRSYKNEQLSKQTFKNKIQLNQEEVSPLHKV